MLTEALDFREECDALYALLATRPDEDFQFATLFKQWTIDDVLGHLHLGDQAVLATLDGEHAYAAAASPLREAMAAGLPLTVATSKCLNGLHGRKLLERWHSTTAEVARRYAETDAARRVAWGKVHMSARSCISARVMETWSHGQEIYDRLDQVRHDTDRIKGVAFLGVNTFGFTFSNRGLEPPAEKPFVKLTAPSGAVWTWNSPAAGSSVEGSAVQFCQVVAQTRSVGDTQLVVKGEAAIRWMSIAQCFAGAPEDPPPPGSRRRHAEALASFGADPHSRRS